MAKVLTIIDVLVYDGQNSSFSSSFPPLPLHSDSAPITQKGRHISTWNMWICRFPYYNAKRLVILACWYTALFTSKRARSARGGRADKPQHHEKRWNKMYISVDWLFSRARPGFTRIRYWAWACASTSQLYAFTNWLLSVIWNGWGPMFGSRRLGGSWCIASRCYLLKKPVWERACSETA